MPIQDMTYSGLELSIYRVERQFARNLDKLAHHKEIESFKQKFWRLPDLPTV